MLAENLKALRKAKGLSQEELAARLHVVRQTVSKWEKGRSVPDADLLIRLAEELDTTSAALLGPEVPPEAERGGTAEQLARIAEQLAVKNRPAPRARGLAARALRLDFDNDSFISAQTGALRFEFDEPVAWTVDGEFGGSVTEVEIHNERRAIDIIVP